MARVTVEDCRKVIPNNFLLVLLSAERVKQIHSGSPITVKSDNDKAPIIALREIAFAAKTKISVDYLYNSLVARHQTMAPSDIALEDDMEDEFTTELIDTDVIQEDEMEIDDDSIFIGYDDQQEVEFQDEE